MKKLMAILSLVVLVSACAQMGRLVNYSISEADVQQLVEQQLQAQEVAIDFPGVRAALDVQQVGITIDDDGDGLVHLSADSLLNTTVLGATYPVQANIRLAGLPSYSGQHHAIFLRNVSLEGSYIDAGSMRFSLDGIADEIYDFLNQWLDENPIYRFDQDDSRYLILRDMGLNISVEPGRLRVTQDS